MPDLIGQPSQLAPRRPDIMRNVARRLGPLVAALWLVVGLAGEGRAGFMVGQPDGPDSFILNFNENGTGTLQTFNLTTGMYNPAVPSNGTVVSGVLTFRLPEFVVPGDIGIRDASGALSDLLRLRDDAQSGLLELYSADVGGGKPADIGIPSNANPLIFITENADGTATFGSGPPATTNLYNLSGSTEGVVPEPATLTSAVTAFVLLAGSA